MRFARLFVVFFATLRNMVIYSSVCLLNRSDKSNNPADDGMSDKPIDQTVCIKWS